jgi:hypothetical protein
VALTGGVGTVLVVVSTVDTAHDVWNIMAEAAEQEDAAQAPAPTASGAMGADSSSASPPPDEDGNDDKANRDKKIQGHEKALEEHKQKLAEYKANPDKFDNKGFLKNAPSQEVRDSIIQGRIRGLENTISNVQRQIDMLKGMP